MDLDALDWLGPREEIGGNAVRREMREERDHFVLRIEATEALRGIANGDFATVSSGWRFSPTERAAGVAPDGMRAFGYQYTEFAMPTTSDDSLARWFFFPLRPPIVMPLWLLVPDGRAVLFAPLDNFHEQLISVANGVAIGWHGHLDEVPAGFATEMGVFQGDSPRDCLEGWGALLRERYGTVRRGRYADSLGRKPSYWTDNGAAYWYRTEPGTGGVGETLEAVVADLRARDIPFGTVQLDSWFYPHQVLRPFDTEEWVVPPTGLIEWDARDDILPEGVPALAERLGRPPLATHIRHLSSASPYVEQFDCWTDGERAHPKGPELYERWLDQAVAWGVETFEHDWLIECWMGVRGLREEPGRARRWQEALDRTAGARGMTLQWCMPSPADMCQTVTLRNVTSIRTSGDHGYLVGPGFLWAWFLYTNALARVLHLQPFKDVFMSDGEHAEMEALLSSLSTGPVGVGDRVGRTDAALVRRTCRGDGVLVKPYVAVAAADRCFYENAVARAVPLVGECWTQHAAGRWTYVVAANVFRGEQPITGRVTLADVGVEGPAVAWDWRRRTAELIEPGDGWDVALDPLEWDYRVLAPVLPGDVAVFGDVDLFVSAGDMRIGDVRDGVVTVLGAGETVTITGWSAANGVWTRDVEISSRGWERVTL